MTREAGRGSGDDPSVEETSDPLEEARQELHRRRLRAMARVRRWTKRFWRSVLGVIAVFVGSVLLISQTGRGQAFALERALDRLEQELAGNLTVRGIRSGTLLTGATVDSVTLETDDGRPFLRADSIQLSYSLASALVGGSPVRHAVIWGLDLEISRYSADQPMNVTRLLAQQGNVERSGDSEPFSLGQVGVREGRVRILTPALGPSPRRLVDGPNGERLRELVLNDVDLDLENAVLDIDAETQFSARLASFSSAIGIVDEPLVLREVFGQIEYGPEGIRVADGAYRLSESLLRGDVVLGPESAGSAWRYRSDLETDGWGDLADLQWLDPRIPEGRFRGGATVTAGDGVRVDLDDMEVSLEASHLVFEGPVRFTNTLVTEGVHVTADPLAVERLEPWIGQELPFEGWLSGEATFSGPLRDVSAEGRVTVVPLGYGGGPTTVDFGGTVHWGEQPGATDFAATLSPLNYDLLAALWSDVPWAGSGSASLEFDGRLDDGMDVEAAAAHTSRSGLASRAEAQGTVWRGAEDESWITSLRVDLLPLAVGALHGFAPDLGLGGELAGPVSVDGPLDDLRVSGDLASRSGDVAFDATVNVLRPAEGYELEATADSLVLADFVSTIPEGTRWSGSLRLRGEGFAPETMTAEADAVAARSRLGSVSVDSVATALRVSRGVLITDSLAGRFAGVDVTAQGRLGLVPGSWGASRLRFEGESLVGLRPWLMGVADSLLVRDGLTALDRDLLRLDGIDPDTLPAARDVRLDGRVRGEATLSGTLEDLDLGLLVSVVDGAWKQNEVDSIRVAFSATDLPATTGAWEIGATANGILWDGRSFDQGGFEADMFRRGGEGRVQILRREGELYTAEGRFRLDSIGGEVDVREATILVDQDEWQLSRTGVVAWDGDRVSVDPIEISRVGDDPMLVAVEGSVTRGGESDFSIDIEGLHAENVVNVLQSEVDVGGHIDLTLDVRGPAEDPSIDAEFQVLGGRYGPMQLTRFEGSLDYEARSAVFEIDGWDGDRPVLSSSGAFPIDLGLLGVEDRIVEAPMDVSVSADSLDAAIALSALTSLDGVLGTVSGDVRVRGTPTAPRPEGELRLSDGAWSIEAIGVRHTEVNGDLQLNADRTVDVNLSSTGSGRSDVTGIVDLRPFSNPRLDLEFTFDRFLGVARPDIEGVVTGSFQLQGVYRRAVAQGALTVDEGTIYVDELQRAAGVVDLTEALFYDAVLAVDTAALTTQPILAGFENPFFDNLRVNVDMSVPRGSWLRSIESNVELSGDLVVLYDRQSADFVLLGELQAVRGSHIVLGRSFELEGGTVNFIGRPGLNPDLDIQASSRIRRQGDPPFDVNAEVTGTLVRPVVTLTTEETGLAEEDLVSYLIFGQPSGQLGGRSGAELGRVQDSNALNSAVQGGFTVLGGAFVNRLGGVLARETSLLDYVSLQQGAGQTLGGDYLFDTHVEVGSYIGNDAFVVMVFRLRDAGGQDQNRVAGVRVEWALTDDYNIEGFFEDRFLRSGSQQLGGSAGLFDDDRVLGFFFFREWGYTPGRDAEPDPNGSNDNGA